MEYLPEKKRTQQAQIRKKEEKLKNFRKYLADKDVVLAMVKFILSVRSQKQWPEDPHKHMIDFFGNYKDPMWDKMDEWREENEDIRQKHIPELT